MCIATVATSAVASLLAGVELNTIQCGALRDAVLQLTDSIRNNLAGNIKELIRFEISRKYYFIVAYLIERKGYVGIDAKHFTHGVFEGI